jgi:two-component system LytT family response regulator
MTIRCIAVDDEPLALVKMEDYIQKIPFLELKGSFDNPMRALEFLKQNAVDLLFLDIRMDQLTGIQLLEVLSNKPRVILTTAYDSYALKGYELDVSDYLLKPISFDRFLKAVEKVYDELKYIKEPVHMPVVSSLQHVQSHPEYFFIKTEYRMQKVFFKDILFIEGMKDYLRIHTLKERIMTLMSFSKMEQILPGDNFVRIHKSYIIALDKIESIEKSKIKIATHDLPIGEMYKKLFMEILENRKLV